MSKKLVCAILLAIASGLALASCGAGAKDIPLDDGSSRPKVDPADLRYLLQALRNQISRCWNWSAPVSGADAEVPSASVRFKLKQDGSLAGEPVVVRSHADPSQAVAKTALAAVKRCQPFKLPPNQYEFWQEVQVNFVTNAPM